MKRRTAVITGIAFLFFFVFSSWLMFHTFSYDEQARAIRIAFKLWSDFGAHIPMIRSFSLGSNLPTPGHIQPIEYAIFPGEPIRFHFLFDMGVGILEKMGLRIDWALNIPSIAGFTILLGTIYLLPLLLFGSVAAAVLSVIFFLFNGSFGFIRFFQTHPLSLQTPSDIWHAKDFPAFAPWGPGDVTAFWNLNIYTNQRHLSIAFAWILLFMITLLLIERWPRRRQIPFALLWGISIGALPYFHQPALLILAVLMGWYFLAFPKLRLMLAITGLLSLGLILPQLLLTGHVDSAQASLYPGYIIHNELEKLPTFWQQIARFAAFWWQNFGLHSVLIPLGFFVLPRRARLLFFPLIPLFIIPNLFKFSVEISANHKFLNFVLVLGNMISAYTLVWFVRHVRALKFPVLLQSFLFSLVGIFLVFLTLSGVIDLFVIANDTKGTVADVNANEIAAWIAQNTPKDAIFLNSSYLYHPASIAGRRIFLGWPYFPWSAGYPENRMPIMDSMYETKNAQERCELLSRYRITHITVEDVPNDYNLPKIDLAFFMDTWKPAYVSSTGKYAIFTTGELCKK